MTVFINQEAFNMKDALTNPAHETKFVCSSMETPTGCQIRCFCGNVFTSAESPQDEICSDCGRTFHPGYIVDVEVVSKRSGMSLGMIHCEGVGKDLDHLVHGAVAEKFGADCSEFCSWQLKNSSAAYFGLK
jgi:hypothetical protein